MSKFFEEIFEQPKALRDTVQFNIAQEFQRNGKPYLFTGMGSSLAASELVVSYLNNHGINAVAIDNSELLHYQTPILDQYQVIVVSQSGESIEARELISRYPNVSVVTNTHGSTAATLARQVFYTSAGEEKAIASSKSFTTTAALLLLIGSRIAGREVVAGLLNAANVIENELSNATVYRKGIGEFLDPLRPLVLLGRGPSVYTARQGSLTLKETARMYAEGMSAAQFRHGPFELIKENLQAIFFNPKGVTYELNRQYVLEMARLGAKVLYFSDQPLEHERIYSLVIPSVDEFLSVIPYSLVVQLAAVELSARRGLVAGEAQLISKVTGRE